jgi:nucleotidyltransferase/DNA polymerase involved in DNA repair
MTVFAIVDCNNFYVSCERVFNPSLNGKPVIVLSNNDGCAVARSNEVKKLDIGMGSPIFKQKAIIEKHGIHVFSSNYALYGDMSQRVVQVLSEFCDDLEVYSVDESFLDITSTRTDQRIELGRAIKATVKKQTGIPVSVGMAHTKTLSKIAVRLSKKSPKADGVLDLTDHKHHDRALELTPIDDVWGVGWRYARFLKVYGITNALQLRDADKNFIRKKRSKRNPVDRGTERRPMLSPGQKPLTEKKHHRVTEFRETRLNPFRTQGSRDHLRHTGRRKAPKGAPDRRHGHCVHHDRPFQAGKFLLQHKVHAPCRIHQQQPRNHPGCPDRP